MKKIRIKARTIIMMMALAAGFWACEDAYKQKVVAPKGLSITPTEILMKPTSKAQQLSVVPIPVEATVGAVKWSTNAEGVATVSEDGMVYPIGIGTAVITAEVDGLKATVNVKVDTVNVAKIKMEAFANIDSLVKGSTLTVLAEASPKGATGDISAGTKPEFVWTSANEAVAKVIWHNFGEDKDTAVIEMTGIDTTYIYCSIGSVKDSIRVIGYVPLEDFSIKEPQNTNDSIAVEKDYVVQLEMATVPADATNPQWKYKTKKGDKVVSVSDEGKVMAIEPGIDTITISCQGKTAELIVYVKPTPLQSIQIKDIGDIALYDEVQFEVITVPENASGLDLRWYSSDPSIAECTVDGLVTALKTGTCTIFVTTGETIASLEIDVKLLPVSIDDLVGTWTVNESVTDDISAGFNASAPFKVEISKYGTDSIKIAQFNTHYGAKDDLFARIYHTGDVVDYLIMGAQLMKNLSTLAKEPIVISPVATGSFDDDYGKEFPAIIVNKRTSGALYFNLLGGLSNYSYFYGVVDNGEFLYYYLVGRGTTFTKAASATGASVRRSSSAAYSLPINKSKALNLSKSPIRR